MIGRLPIVVRVSALSTYPDCERRGAARLFRREIEAAGFKLRSTPRGIGAVIGTAVHKSAEVSLREKAKTGALPPLSMVLDVANDSLTDQLGAGEVMFEGARGTTFNAAIAGSQVLSMARVYHFGIAPLVEPIIVEQRLEAEVEPGLVLSGQPDTVAREPRRVRDLKTGARPPSSYAAQLGGYSLLARSHQLDVDSAAIDFVQRVSPKKVQPPPVSKHAGIADAETAASNILRRIAQNIETFRHGDEQRRIHPGDPWSFLANPSSRLCSPKYCPAFGTEFCREGDPTREE